MDICSFPWSNWGVLNSSIILIRFCTDPDPCALTSSLKKKKKSVIYSSASWRYTWSSNDDLREDEQHLTDLIIVMRTIHHMISDLCVKRHPAMFQAASCQFLRVHIHFIRHDDAQIAFDISLCTCSCCWYLFTSKLSSGSNPNHHREISTNSSIWTSLLS